MFLPKFYLGSLTLLICSSYGTLAYRKPLYQDSPLKHVRNYHQTSGNRSAKYLFPFAVINFAPEPCSPINQQFNEGVCLSKKRCSESRGDAMGSCQQGLGTCCKFIKQCSAMRRTVTVLETVENLASSNTAGSCEFVFPKQPGICQIRLDFTMLTLQEAQMRGPNAGNCQSESLTVSGAGNIDGVLKVCGRLSGQHMILSYGSTSEAISVMLHSEMLSSSYNIRATQIPCSYSNKIPDDCLQYYDTTTAAIKSFGFPRQLNSQRYTICVKPKSGGNMLTWDKCTDSDATDTSASRFKVSVQPTPVTKPCLTDWIAIDSNKVCGEEFRVMSTPLGSNARIRVNFDENETGNDVFNVTVPANSGNIGNPTQYCMDLKLNGGTPIFAPPFPTVPLCTHITGSAPPMCMCRFSSNADSASLAFEMDYSEAGGAPPPGYNCPRVEGFVAVPEKIDQTTGDSKCRYYANVRITDNEDTGFCLRYQSM